MENKGPVKLFPDLYNIEDFLCQSHPKYHPATQSYQEYWTEQEKYCLEGKWGHDFNGIDGGWRYMPGNLYYYINLCKIILESKSGATDVKGPLLRDVEWMLSYGWLAARKFSGFEYDKNYTCHRIVKRIEEVGIDGLTPKQQIQFREYEDNLRKPDGSLKEYVDAVQYLYRTFENPLGRALYQNEALNFCVLGSRGFGKSYFCANAVVGHEYNFYGKVYFDDEYLIDPSPAVIFVGAALGSKSSDLLSKFKMTQDYLKVGPGSWGEFKDFTPGYFHNSSKGTLEPTNKLPYRHEYEVKEGGEWITKGTKSRIHHGIYTTENPQAAVGTRPSVMVVEEFGLLANALNVHGANETCQIRDTKFGSSFYIGTGGNMEKITEPKIMFEDAVAYNFIGYKDVFEGRSNKIGFFLPAYYVDNSFKDSQGNTDLKGAWAQEMYEREQKRKARNAAALTEYVMSRPIVPSEMFLSIKSRFFPTALLKERLTQLQKEKIVKSVGYFTYTDATRTEVKFNPDPDLKPIEELNLKSDADVSGAFVIYEHPPEDKPLFPIRRPLYKIVYDPVKDDGGGASLASILIYKGFISSDWSSEKETLQDDIVGEYIGRVEKVEDIHEMVIMAALYFGARVLIENNLPDFIRYCRLRNLYHILQPTPHEAISKIIKNPGRKYEVGVTMSNSPNSPLNNQCEQLINDMLVAAWKKKGDLMLEWLYKLKSKRLLLELINYNRDDNFDHVSSMKLLALWNSNEVIYKTENPLDTPDYREKWRKSYEAINTKKVVNPFYDY